LQQVKLPSLKKDEVLIKVTACGVCTTELPVFDGSLIGTPGVSFRYRRYPADLGHEVVGKINAVGKNVKSFKKGDSVTGLTYSGCGFARYLIEKERNLIKVPKGIKLEYALGEPLMSIMSILREIAPSIGDDVLIVGDGFMSLLMISALSRYSLSNLIVVGHHKNRLSLAKKLGTSAIINSKTSNARNKVMAITENKGVEISIDFGGTPESLRLAASLCKAKSRAKLVLAANYDNNMPLTIGNYMQNRAPILIPAYPNHSPNKEEDLKRAMWALSNGVFPIEKLITHKFSLSELSNAMENARSRKDGYIKGVVFPWA